MKNDLSILVNGRSVNYSDSGKNTLPLLFIHGFPFDKTMWDPQFDFFKESHRVISYDLPGFGGSQAMEGEVSIAGYADHLIQFLDALAIEKSVVCGLSMGGYILLNAAERYSDRLDRIILADTQCAADTEEAAKKRFETISEIEKKGLTEFTEGFLKKAFSKKTQEKDSILVDRIRKVILSNKVSGITAALKALAERKETCSQLETITLPTLILCGAEDELTPVKLSEYLFDKIPNAEMHVIPETGHLSNLEKSGVFNDLFFNFVSDIIL